MNGLTILHFGHDSSRRAAGGSGVHRSHRTCGTSPTHSPVASPLASLREPCTRSDLASPVRPCIGAQTGPIMITRRDCRLEPAAEGAPFLQVAVDTGMEFGQGCPAELQRGGSRVSG